MPKSIATTHVGSLPRPYPLAAMLFAKEGVQLDPNQSVEYDSKIFDQLTQQAVTDIVNQQAKVGISIPSDGEMSKLSYATYIKDRLHGFSGDSERRTPADLLDFPNFMQRAAKSGGTPSYRRPQCVEEVTLNTLEPLQEDITRFKSALQQADYQQGFMNAASPGVIALFQPSTFHKSHEDYLINLAEVMRHEYEMIVNAGLMLQLDCPDIGLGKHMQFRELSNKDYLKIVALHIEVLNNALRNIPGDKVRLHICWGNYEGPHHHDIELQTLLPLLLQAKPRHLLFENSNPRHAHEWEAWQQIDIPDDYHLYPGVIDSTTNFIEHPELVKQRLQRFTNLVGNERVIASSDCGFSTFAGFGAVDTDIVWAKLQTLVEGAKRAT